MLPSDLFAPGADPLPLRPVNASEEMRLEIRARALVDHYFFCKFVLGYSRLKPEVHVPICRFLEDTEGVFIRRLLLQPRSTFKTTIQTIGQTIRDVVRNPELRILIVAGTATNAERFMMEIRKHFEMNDMLRWLFPECIHSNFNSARWNNQELELPRKSPWKEPTIDAIGAGGMIESRHYDIIRVDDPTGEAEFKSPAKMKGRIEWMDGLESLLITPNHLIDMAATHWGQVDVPNAFMKAFGGMDKETPLGPRATKKGLVAKYWLPDIEDGKSVFPEVIPMDFLIRMKQRNPIRYYAQYANRPTRDGPSTFKGYIRYFKIMSEGPFRGHIQRLDKNGDFLGDPIDPFDLTRIAVFDPAVSETTKASRNAMFIVAKGTAPDRFVLDGRVGHYPPDESVSNIFELDAKWNPEFWSIEGVAYQKALKYWINERAEHEKLPDIAIVEYKPESSVVKDERIKGMQPAFRAGFWWINVDQLELQEELENWPTSEFRDGMDALAQTNEYWGDAEDVVSLSAKRKQEKEFVRNVVGGNVRDDEEEWNEWKFLRDRGVTGYGARRSMRLVG